MKEEFSFKKETITRYESDFRIFNPSVIQYKIVDEICSDLAAHIGLEKTTVRSMIIILLAKYQVGAQEFAFQGEDYIPPRKIGNMFEIFNGICELFSSMLEDGNQKQSLCKFIDSIFEDYIEKYAHR